MPQSSTIKVLDAFTLFGLITAIEASDESGYEGFDVYRSVYCKIKRSHERILISKRITREYQREAQRYGFSFAMIQPFADRLRRENVLTRKVTRNLTGALSGLPASHKVFLEDSVGAGAAFFITRRREWRNITGRMNREYGLKIVTPEQFLEEE